MPSLLFNRLLLIFALLFAQMGGLAHGISHALTDQSPKSSQRSEQSLPHDKYCDQCAAYAQIGSVVGSNTVNFFLGETCETLNFNSFSSCPAHTFVAFAARAPPYAI
jgi:hypothetical protein